MEYVDTVLKGKSKGNEGSGPPVGVPDLFTAGAANRRLRPPPSRSLASSWVSATFVEGMGSSIGSPTSIVLGDQVGHS
ncbi:hypothetical protein CRG98_047642 [Punica granatum]|uniref:Uncharacterized protein n=1 Tax=Punica granatum TaxID=22663 RepID=A0A2I0HJR6_PUNGR|nr:hypothetical protein CRG98_047642 [Punica granatum]